MNEILNLKLDRCFWISLLEQNKIIEAVSSFNSNIANLHNMKKIREFKNFSDDIDEEIKRCQDNFYIILSKKANEYISVSDFCKALEAFTFLVRVTPNDYNIIKNYLNCLAEFKQNDLVEIFAEKLLSFNQNILDTHKYLADIFSKIENYEKSCYYFEQYMQLKNGDTKIAEDYNLLGCYYHKLFDSSNYKKEYILKAIENFIKAHELDTQSKVYLKNITIVLPLINDYGKTKKYWEKIFKLNNINYDDMYDYSALCLKTKDFDGWHEYYDGRLKKETNRAYFPDINKPMWDGKIDIKNKTLLVYCEQGFGDTVLSSLFVPYMLNYTKNIIFVVQDALFNLFNNRMGEITVLPVKDCNLASLNFDYYIPTMSILTALKLDEKKIKETENKFVFSGKKNEFIKSKYFDNTNLKIGLSFKGANNINISRNIPLKEFEKLKNIKNASIYLLNKDLTNKEKELAKNNGFITIAEDCQDFEETAVAIENCDIIISSDNCILNLAGLLKKQTLGIYNFHNEFRWFDLKGEDVVWYKTVKPFVTDEMNNWSPVVDKVIEEVSNYTK